MDSRGDLNKEMNAWDKASEEVWTEEKLREAFDKAFGTYGEKIKDAVGKHSNYTYESFFDFTKRILDKFVEALDQIVDATQNRDLHKDKTVAMVYRIAEQAIKAWNTRPAKKTALNKTEIIQTRKRRIKTSQASPSRA